MTHQILEPVAQLGVEAVARKRDHHGDAILVQVRADEELDVAALLQVEQANEGLAELLRAGREELVLGEGLEERDERLVVVRPLEEVLGDGDLAELPAEDRRLRGRLHVRLAREDAEQPQQRDRVAALVDALHRDVVHLGVAVDGREAVRLRDDQEVAADQALAQVRLDGAHGDRRRVPRAGVVGQDPEPGARHDRELPVGEDVLAVAEQDEVPVEQPLEEGSRLLDLVERVAGGARARRVDHLRHASPHRLVVTDGRLDVAEHEPNARFELAELLRSEVAAHLEVHHRLAHRRLASMHDPPYAAFGVALGPDHRVVDEPDVEPPGAQLLRHRVDEERRVLAVRLDDRPHGLVPVVGQRRVEARVPQAAPTPARRPGRTRP